MIGSPNMNMGIVIVIGQHSVNFRSGSTRVSLAIALISSKAVNRKSAALSKKHSTPEVFHVNNFQQQLPAIAL